MIFGMLFFFNFSVTLNKTGHTGSAMAERKSRKRKCMLNRAAGTQGCTEGCSEVM